MQQSETQNYIQKQHKPSAIINWGLFLWFILVAIHDCRYALVLPVARKLRHYGYDSIFSNNTLALVIIGAFRLSEM